MGIFDKLFGKSKNQDKKIKVKMVNEIQEDEQAQFLKPEKKSMTVKVEPETPKNKTMTIKVETETPEKKSPARKSSVTRVKAESTAQKKKEQKAEVSVKIAEKPKQTAKKKSTTVKVAVTSDDDSYTKEAVTVTEGKDTRNGKFDIQRAKDGRFFFNLYASNHTVIAYSQIYSSTSAAMNGINSIITNATKAPIEDTTLKNPTEYPCPKWEIYIDKAGEYRFRLYAANGLQICHSAHGYSTKSGCKGGIDSIGRFASDAAKIDKSYLK